MSEQEPQTEETAEASPVEPRRPGRLLPVFTLAVVVIALAASAYSLVAVEQLRGRLANQLEAFRDLDGRAASVKGNLAELRSGNRALAKRLDEVVRKQALAEERMNRLLSERRDGSADWALAEVEYLLVVATHRLVLAHDVRTALAAMEAADTRLRGLDLPGLTEVRSRIASDMDALKAVPRVDITGLTLFLSDLSRRAGKLPVNPQRLVTRRIPRGKPVPAQASDWHGLLHEMWRSLKSLVVVTRRSDGIRLLPQEKYLVIQNLQLQIEAARLAVLQRDTRALHASVKGISRWLRTYFDLGDQGVASAMQSVQQMGKLNLEPKLPDISSSLETLRAYVHQRKEDSTPAPPPDTGPDVGGIN